MDIQLGYKPSKVNVWLLAIIFIPLGMTLYGLWLFHVEPIYSFVTPVIMPIVEGARGLGNTFIPAITDYVSKNPLTVLTASITIGGLIGGKLWTNYVNNQKAEAEAKAEQAITNSLTVGKDYADLQAKYEALQQQVQNAPIADTQGLLSEAQSLITQKTEENKTLLTENTLLERLANPSEAERIQWMTEHGYEVKKKVTVK
jgi:hypothetical protein